MATTTEKNNTVVLVLWKERFQSENRKQQEKKGRRRSVLLLLSLVDPFWGGAFFGSPPRSNVHKRVKTRPALLDGEVTQRGWRVIGGGVVCGDRTPHIHTHQPAHTPIPKMRDHHPQFF